MIKEQKKKVNKMLLAFLAKKKKNGKEAIIKFSMDFIRRDGW